MSSKRILLVSTLVLLVLGMVSAAPIPGGQVEGFTIHLDVSEDGTITPREVSVGKLSLEIPGDEEPMVLDFGGLTMKNVSKDRLESFMGKLGLAVEIPEMAMEPEQVKAFTDHDVRLLAVHKKSHGEFQEIGIFANNVKTLEATMSDEALDLALEKSRLRKSAAALLSPFLMMEEATVSVRFPGTEGKPAFNDKIEAEAGAALNLIEAGATISGGEVGSVGGVTVQEANQVLRGMGAAPIWNKLAFAPLEELQADRVVATAGRNGFRLEDDQGRWVETAWDEESREALYGLIPVALDFGEMAGYSVPSMESLSGSISLAEKWLPNTDVKLVVHDTSVTQEDLPRIRIGQVLEMELDEEGRLSLSGVDLGYTTLDYEALEPFRWAAVRFDGEEREIRSTVAGKAMPILFLGDQAIAQTGSLVSGQVPDLEQVPWKKGDALLNRIEVQGVVFDITGQAPDQLDLEYGAERSAVRRLAVLPILVGRKDGHVALGDPERGALDVTQFMGARAASLEAIVKTYAAYVPQELGQATLTVDSNEVTVGFNGPAVGIRWDQTLRGNLLGVVDQATGMKAAMRRTLEPVGLSEAIIDQVETALIERLVGAGWLRWGVKVTLLEDVKGIPPTKVEQRLSQMGLLPKPAEVGK